MDVTIGIRNVARELEFEIEGDASGIAEQIRETVASGTPLKLTDARGREVIVPAEALGYVIVGDPEPRRVGFAL